MKEKLHYKGFTSPIHFDEKHQIFHGQIEGIVEEITFDAPTSKALKKVFIEAVEDYLFLKSVSQGC